MIPFRIFDRQKKEMWIVLNFHPEKSSYLVAKEDDGDNDGAMKLLSSEEMCKMRLIDFLNDFEDDEFNQ